MTDNYLIKESWVCGKYPVSYKKKVWDFKLIKNKNNKNTQLFRL